MNAIFLYEDGQGKIYDQSGDDTMDLEEDVNLHHLETFTIRLTANLWSQTKNQPL